MVGPPDFLVDRPVHQQLLRFAAVGLARILRVGGVGEGHDNREDGHHGHELDQGKAECAFHYVHVNSL